MTARVRRWWGIGRRLVLDAAGALAVGLVVAAAVWLLPRLLTPLPGETTLLAAPSRTPYPPTPDVFTPTPVPPMPPGTPFDQAHDELADVTYMALKAPDDQFVLYLFGASALRETPASRAVRNLGHRLSADAASSALAVVEVVGGEQIILDPDTAPSIYLPPGARSGDRVRLFAIAPDGTASSAAEFTLASAEGWQALDLHQSPTPAELRVELPTPTPQLIDVSSPVLPSFSVREGPEVVLRLERVYVTPEEPVQGQPFTVTAVIRNAGDVNARVPVWFGAFRRSQDPYPKVSSSVNSVTLLAGEEVQLIWDGKDQWRRDSLKDLSRGASRLILRAGVNVNRPGGMTLSLQPEAEKRDNVAEISVDFLPYQPQVSDACPPGDNLWLEPGQAQVGQSYSQQKIHSVIVHNDRNVKVTRVALRVADAEGRRFLTYARWVQPCGGTDRVNAIPSAGEFTYPLTVTLNPADAPSALPESDWDDNVIVLSAGEVCTGTTDLWLTADGVTFEGNDLLVTVHLSGSSPSRGFGLRVYHTADGSVIASRHVSSLASWSCNEPKVMYFEGVLMGLSGGALMVQIDTESSRIESVYPQHNNTATVPLP